MNPNTQWKVFQSLDLKLKGLSLLSRDQKCVCQEGARPQEDWDGRTEGLFPAGGRASEGLSDQSLPQGNTVATYYGATTWGLPVHLEVPCQPWEEGAGVTSLPRWGD